MDFLTYLKGLFPAFSLSSRDNVLQHVSLVITPGRKGTNVTYNPLQCIKRELVSRDSNKNIADHVLGFVSVYLPEPDRKYYLSCSQNSSLNPNNISFLPASRNPTTTDMDLAAEQPGCDQQDQQSNNVTPQQQVQVEQRPDISSFQPPPIQQQQEIPPQVSLQPPTLQQQSEINQQDTAIKEQPPLNVVKTHHQNQPIVSLQYDKPPQNTTGQQPLLEEQPLANSIDFEEYRNFLAFKEQMKQQREQDRVIQQQQQPQLQEVSRSNNNKRPLEDSQSSPSPLSTFQIDKQPKSDTSEESSQWQDRMDQMLSKQSETFNDMKTLIGSIQGFFERNNQPSQPTPPVQQQSTSSQQKIQQQPPPLVRPQPVDTYTQQQQKPTFYNRMIPEQQTKSSLFSQGTGRNGGLDTMDKILRGNPSSVRFENDLLRQLKPQYGGGFNDRMIQANREPNGQYLDPHTVIKMYTNDILDRLHYSTRT